jgi:hypothetical protein
LKQRRDRGRHQQQRGDAEPAEQVRERRDVGERVVDERERDAVEQRRADERRFGGEAPAKWSIPLRRASRASGW